MTRALGPTTALIYAPGRTAGLGGIEADRWRERVLRVEVLGGVRHLQRPVQQLVRALVEGESEPRDIEARRIAWVVRADPWVVRARQRRTYAGRARDRRRRLRRTDPAFRAREAEYSRRYRAKRRLAREVGA